LAKQFENFDGNIKEVSSTKDGALGVGRNPHYCVRAFRRGDLLRGLRLHHAYSHIVVTAGIACHEISRDIDRTGCRKTLGFYIVSWAE
jgi:hypothetical protein